MENCAIEDRVVRYWTIRSHDFGAVRKNELGSIMGRRWQEELEARLPQGSPLNILDVGTGTGFFAILMAKLGHKVTGIDLTPDAAGTGESLRPVAPGAETGRAAPEFRRGLRGERAQRKHPELLRSAGQPLRSRGHDGSAGGGKQRHHFGAGRGAEAARVGRSRAEKGRVFPLPDGFDGRPAGAGGG